MLGSARDSRWKCMPLHRSRSLATGTSLGEPRGQWIVLDPGQGATYHAGIGWRLRAAVCLEDRA